MRRVCSAPVPPIIVLSRSSFSCSPPASSYSVSVMGHGSQLGSGYLGCSSFKRRLLLKIKHSFRIPEKAPTRLVGAFNQEKTIVIVKFRVIFGNLRFKL